MPFARNGFALTEDGGWRRLNHAGKITGRALTQTLDSPLRGAPTAWVRDRRPEAGLTESSRSHRERKVFAAWGKPHPTVLRPSKGGRPKKGKNQYGVPGLSSMVSPDYLYWRPQLKLVSAVHSHSMMFSVLQSIVPNAIETKWDDEKMPWKVLERRRLLCPCSLTYGSSFP